jgi:hypothetical protein
MVSVSTVSAYYGFLEACEQHDLLVREVRPGRSARVQCPIHDDTHPSLDVDYKEDEGGVFIVCRAERCPNEQIVAALGLRLRDLYDRPGRTPSARSTARRQRAERIVRLQQRLVDRVAQQEHIESDSAHWLRRSDEFRLVGNDEVAVACLRRAMIAAGFP